MHLAWVMARIIRAVGIRLAVAGQEINHARLRADQQDERLVNGGLIC